MDLRFLSPSGHCFKLWTIQQIIIQSPQYFQRPLAFHRQLTLKANGKSLVTRNEKYIFVN